MRSFLAHLTLVILIFNHSGFPRSVILSCLLIYTFLVTGFFLKNGYSLKRASSTRLFVGLLGLMAFSYLRTNNPNISSQTIFINIYTFIICSAYYASYLQNSLRRNTNPFSPIVNVVSFSSLVNILIFVFFGNLRFGAPDLDSVLIKFFTDESFRKMNCTIGTLSANHNAVLIAMICPLIFLINRKIWRNALLLLNITALVLIDSRGAFFAAIISPGLLYPVWRFRFTYLPLFFAAMLPFQALFFTFFLPWVNENLDFEWVSRNSAELYTANSRTVIWAEIIDDITQISGATLVGSGEYGNLAFKSSVNYLQIFRNFDDSEVKSCHNTYFQIVFDGGYLTLVVLALVFWQSMVALAQIKQNKLPLILNMSLFIFLLAGASEVLIGFYYMPITFVLLLILFYGVNFHLFRSKNALQVK